MSFEVGITAEIFSDEQRVFSDIIDTGFKVLLIYD